MLEIGSIVEGKVSGLTGFGAFVSLPDGKSGMVHISEVSGAFVKEIREHLSVGQSVRVKIISISEDGKIGLSIKQAVADEQPKPKKPPVKRQSNVWQGQPRRQSSENMSFEDMMARFKQVSDEKMTDLRHAGESKHGAGYSRRGRGGNSG